MFASWDELARLYASSVGGTDIDSPDDGGVRAMEESNVGMTGMGFPPQQDLVIVEASAPPFVVFNMSLQELDDQGRG